MSRSTCLLRTGQWKKLLLVMLLFCASASSADGANVACSVAGTSNATPTSVVTCWARFRHPRLAETTGAVIEAGHAAIFAAKGFLQSCQSKLRLNAASVLNACLVVEQKSLESLAPLLPTQEPALPPAPGLAAMTPSASYWGYYHDCDRWGIELTRAIEPSVGTVESKTIPNRSKTSATQLADAGPWIPSLKVAGRWFLAAWQRLEFASIETSVHVGQEHFPKNY